jgi:adenylate kinase
MGVGIDVVLNIEVSDERIVTRMSGRRTCPACGASYHIVYKPTEKEGICDKCGAELTIRKDDDPAVVQSRLETYHKETEPLKDYYEKVGILKTVEGQEELADTTALTLATLGIK